MDTTTFTVEGNSVMIQSVSTYWDENDIEHSETKTAVLTRTGLAEYTATAGDIFEIGQILSPMGE